MLINFLETDIGSYYVTRLSRAGWYRNTGAVTETKKYNLTEIFGVKPTKITIRALSVAVNASGNTTSWNGAYATGKTEIRLYDKDNNQIAFYDCPGKKGYYDNIVNDANTKLYTIDMPPEAEFIEAYSYAKYYSSSSVIDIITGLYVKSIEVDDDLLITNNPKSYCRDYVLNYTAEKNISALKLYICGQEDTRPTYHDSYYDYANLVATIDDTPVDINSRFEILAGQTLTVKRTSDSPSIYYHYAIFEALPSGFNNIPLRENILFSGNELPGDTNLALLEEADVKTGGNPIYKIKEDVRRKPLYLFDFETKTPENLPDTVDIAQLYKGLEYDSSLKCIRNKTISHSGSTNSYIKFEAKAGDIVSLEAYNDSEIGFDFGYAHVTQSATAPSFTTTAGRFYSGQGISGTFKEYSTTIESDGTYYLHLGYRKDSSGTTSPDKVYFKNIKIPAQIDYLGFDNSFIIQEDISDKAYNDGHQLLPLEEKIGTQESDAIQINQDVYASDKNLLATKERILSKEAEVLTLSENIAHKGLEQFKIAEDVRRAPIIYNYTYDCSERYPSDLPSCIDVTELDKKGTFYPNQYIEYKVETAKTIKDGYVNITTEADDLEITIDYECIIPEHSTHILYAAIEIDGDSTLTEKASCKKTVNLSLGKKGNHRIHFMMVCGTTAYTARFLVNSFTIPVTTSADLSETQSLKTLELIQPSPTDYVGHHLLNLKMVVYEGQKGFKALSLKEDIRRLIHSHYVLYGDIDCGPLPESINFTEPLEYFYYSTSSEALVNREYAYGDTEFSCRFYFDLSPQTDTYCSVDYLLIGSGSRVSFEVSGASVCQTEENLARSNYITKQMTMRNTTDRTQRVTVKMTYGAIQSNSVFLKNFYIPYSAEIEPTQKDIVLKELISIYPAQRAFLTLKERGVYIQAKELMTQEAIYADVFADLPLKVQTSALSYRLIALKERVLQKAYKDFTLEEKAYLQNTSNLTLDERILSNPNQHALEVFEAILATNKAQIELLERTIVCSDDALALKETIESLSNVAMIDLFESVQSKQKTLFTLEENIVVYATDLLDLEEFIESLTGNEALALLETIQIQKSAQLEIKENIVAYVTDLLALKETIKSLTGNEILALLETAKVRKGAQLEIKENIPTSMAKRLLLKEFLKAKGSASVYLIENVTSPYLVLTENIITNGFKVRLVSFNKPVKQL